MKLIMLFKSSINYTIRYSYYNYFFQIKLSLYIEVAIQTNIFII